MASAGGESVGRVALHVSSFLQIMSGPTQERLSPLTFLKLGNQVQPGGAGEEWAGPEGGGPISRIEGTGGVALTLRSEGQGETNQRKGSSPQNAITCMTWYHDWDQALQAWGYEGDFQHKSQS